jgi:hypothetical protein
MGSASRKSEEPSRGEQAAIAARVREVLPDAEALVVGAPGGGYELRLSARREVEIEMPGGGDPLFAVGSDRATADAVALANLRWKVLLVVGVVAMDNDQIVSFAGSWPGAGNPTWRSSVRAWPGVPLPKIGPRGSGTVSREYARAQLESNLGVFRSACRATVRGTRVEVVLVDAARHLFGLEADVRVSDLNALHPDLVDGLSTGLSGDEAAIIEGLAVNVVDDGGHWIGRFHAARLGVGIGIGVIDLADPEAVDVVFPNLTGDPPTSRSARGGTIPGSRRRTEP